MQKPAWAPSSVLVEGICKYLSTISIGIYFHSSLRRSTKRVSLLESLQLSATFQTQLRKMPEVQVTSGFKDPKSTGASSCSTQARNPHEQLEKYCRHQAINSFPSLKKSRNRVGWVGVALEMSQQLRGLAALSEDLDLMPCTHMVASQLSMTSTDIQVNINTHKIKISKAPPKYLIGKKSPESWLWWSISVISALSKWRQGEWIFIAGLRVPNKIPSKKKKGHK